MISKTKKGSTIKVSSIIIFMYSISVLIQSFTAEYESSGFISQLKYVVFLLTCGICLLYMNKTRKFKVFRDELKSILWIIASFAIISIIRSIWSRHFTTRTIQELIFLLIPILFAYCILNTLDKNKIDKCMMFTLVISIVGYFIEIDMGLNEFIKALSSMSFSNSYSMLESSTFAGVSITIAMYFLYFRSNKFGFILSIIFVILTFKRLALVFMVFLIILPKIFNYNRKVNYKLVNYIKIGTLALTIFYFVIMIPENVEKINNMFNIDLYKLTMSRTYRFKLIYYKPNFINTGLGSTYSYMMRLYEVSLEMDMIKLLIEVTPIGVFIFINNMVNIVKKNWYCMILMLFQLFNLITSHSLASVFSWVIFYITVGCILYNNDVNYVQKKKKIIY